MILWDIQGHWGVPQDIGICLKILGNSTFERFMIFGIFNLGTLGDASGHWNMPKNIGKFNFREIWDIQLKILIWIWFQILRNSTFERFMIFGIFNLGTLGDASGHWNMPKNIGKFNFREIRDIQLKILNLSKVLLLLYY